RRPPRMHVEVDRHDDTLRSLRDALRAARQGDLSVRLPVDDSGDGVLGEVVLAFNALVDQTSSFVHEVGRISHRVGAEGRITERAALAPTAGGAWVAAIGSVNS